MTPGQQGLFLFTVSAVITIALGAGIMVWGWPEWLLFAVSWLVLSPIAVGVTLLGKESPGRRPEAVHRRHQPAGTR